MDYIKMNLPALNRFATDYINGVLKKGDFFQYDWRTKGIFSNGLSGLIQKCSRVMKLRPISKALWGNLGYRNVRRQNIEALRKDALVIIGGQQAGLLTGPLYSIHKIISIIKLAKEQSEKLENQSFPSFGSQERTMITTRLIMCIWNQRARCRK